MAGVRAELLLALLLTGTLCLVPVWGWTSINETQLLNLVHSGRLSPSEIVTPTDDSSDSRREEKIPEEEIPEEIPTKVTSKPVGGLSFENLAWGQGFLEEADEINLGEIDAVDAPPRGWATGIGGDDDDDDDDDEDFQVGYAETLPGGLPIGNGGGFQVEYVEPPPRSWESTSGGFQVEYVQPPPRSWESATDGGFQVEYVDGPSRLWDGDTDDELDMEIVQAPPRSWISHTSPGSSGLEVVCNETGFQITLPGSLSNVQVLGTKQLLPVMEAPESCGYEVKSSQNTLNVPFTGCNVKHSDGYSLQLLYVDGLGQTQVATASCKESPKALPRSPTGKPKSKCDPTAKATNCEVASDERVPCGQAGISSLECEKMGCCVASSACFYPLDECTADQHFVFAIRKDGTPAPLDPTKLVLPGHPNCKPAIVNDKVAIFKIKVTECGTRAYTVGETKIYLAEVQSVVQALNLKYGAITRSDPLRFFVECRYGKTGTTPSQSLASIGYMVKIPTSVLPSSVVFTGLFGVTLKIATDETYTKFLANDHAPLSLLLGKPVYLELMLKSPKPDAVLLVNYCLAYPRSAKNALVLVYEGCANTYDQTVSILKISGDPKVRNKRRFVIKAFQFMDQKTNKYLNEEIYFMCSTEVCRPNEKTCAERCFDGKTP